MTSKYVMLECNRLRSLDVQQTPERDDTYKNKWSNLVAQSGILINAGDTISVQQVICNSKGATDEVIEFTGDTNVNNFVDNKTRLNYSFYVNNTGRNCVPMPFINHRTYRGNGSAEAPTLTNLDPSEYKPTLNTTNGTNPAVADIQIMLSRRSLGEFLFAPNGAGAVSQYPQWLGGESNTDNITLHVAEPYPIYYNGNYVFRLIVKQTGIGTTKTNGYFPNVIYPARKKRLAHSILLDLPTGAQGTKIITCAFNSGIVAGDLIQNNETIAPPTLTYGTVESVSHNGLTMQITLVANLTSPITNLTVVYANSPTIPPNDHGTTTGISIKVLTTTGDASVPPNQITSWEIIDCDVNDPHSVRAGDVIMLSVNAQGQLDPNFIEPTAWATFTIQATPDQFGYMSRETNKIDGERYYLVNNFYSGLTNNTEESIGQATTNGDLLDFGTLVSQLDKRTSSCDLEIEPSFATPDNIGGILTDQLHAPNKLSLDNPIDDFYDYTYNNYDFTQRTPYYPNLTEGVRFQDTTQLYPENKPVIVSTPTYKPSPANMYGYGMPEIDFDGEKRQSNQGSFGGLRRVFYNSIAYKDMNRVVGLKNAFYNFMYEKPVGQNIEWKRDIYIARQTTEFANRSAINAVYGDFASIRKGELGTRVCMLNHFHDFSIGQLNTNLVDLPKGALIITNMKYNERNIARLSKSFRKCEEYLGDLRQQVDITSDDYKNHLAVNLDLGMYCDEDCTPQLQKKTGDGIPPNYNYSHHQRNKFANTLEASFSYNNATIVPTDNENLGNPANYFRCGGFQKDFTANDSQQLSNIWIKSRFQEGFIYENAIDPTYVGDKFTNIQGLLQSQRNTTTPYYATQYDETFLKNDTAAGDFKYVNITQDDFTTIIVYDASWIYTQPFRDGMVVVCVDGTIDGISVIGKESSISNVNLEAFVPTQPSFWLDEPFGTVSGQGAGAVGITIRIKTPEESEFFTKPTWTDDGINTRNMDYAVGLARQYDLAVVPVFQPVLQQSIRIGGQQQTMDGDYEDNIPLLAFVSNYTLGAMTKGIDSFDKVNLQNGGNAWAVDIQNSTQGTQIGFDPSFTRNPAVALTNIQSGNQGVVNSCYIGATNPSINFNGDLSRFEISGLNTPIVLGNGLPSDIPENLTANATPEQQCFAVHQQNRIWTSRAKLIGDILTDQSPLGNVAKSYVYNQFNTTQSFNSIMDSQSGIAIESLGLFDNLGNETQITANDFQSYQNTLLSKLGFTLDQLLISVGSEQAFFVNNFLFQDVFSYEKSLNNFVKPLTTGAYISSAEIQALSLNDLSMPMFDLSVDAIDKTANPSCTQGSITAFRLPDKLDFPYLVIYSSIPEGCSNTEFIGGSDSQSLIPAVAYLYRNENNGDFFYGLESDIVFTCVKDYVLSQVDIDIRKPNGSKPRLSPHSAVIFKITKPLEVPNPELILNQKK